MFCKFCGKEIDDNSLFCKYCGKSLDDNGVEAKPIVSESTYNPRDCDIRMSYIKKRRVVFIMICLFSFFLFVSIFFPYLGLDSRKLNDSTSYNIDSEELDGNSKDDDVDNSEGYIDNLSKEYEGYVDDLVKFAEQSDSIDSLAKSEIGEIYDSVDDPLDAKYSLWDLLFGNNSSDTTFAFGIVGLFVFFIAIIIVQILKNNIDIWKSSLHLKVAIAISTLFFVFFCLTSLDIGPSTFNEQIEIGNDFYDYYSLAGKNYSEAIFPVIFTKMIGSALLCVNSFCLIILCIIYSVMQKRYIEEKRKCVNTARLKDLKYAKLKAEMGSTASLVDQVIYEGLIKPVDDTGKSPWIFDEDKIKEYLG